MKALFSKIVISGVGLLGGSVAKASRKYHLADQIIGVCRSESSRKRIESSGAVDRAVLSFYEALAYLSDSAYSEDRIRSDDWASSGSCTELILPETISSVSEVKPVLIVVAVPVNSIVEEIESAVSVIKDLDSDQFFLLTDVGSTKTRIVESLDRKLFSGNSVFIGSHPIAGSEKTGVEAALDSLFEGRRTVITLEKSLMKTAQKQKKQNLEGLIFTKRNGVSAQRDDQSAGVNDEESFNSVTDSKVLYGLDLLRMFWESVGSQVIEMSPEDHDRILARTSHLPQLLSSALSYLIRNDEHFLCGTGFSGMTRLAGSSPVMWNDIFTANRASVLDALDAYIEILNCWKIALQREDDSERLALLKEAKKKRDALGS